MTRRGSVGLGSSVASRFERVRRGWERDRSVTASERHGWRSASERARERATHCCERYCCCWTYCCCAETYCGCGA
eukprot:scaffold218614_cov35-Tisochrysis_lutea.AAC.5